MYQFTATMGDMNPKHSGKRSYRWRGLLAAVIAGWLPAWGLSQALPWGAWGFVLFWILSMPMGYAAGNLIIE